MIIIKYMITVVDMCVYMCVYVYTSTPCPDLPQVRCSFRVFVFGGKGLGLRPCALWSGGLDFGGADLAHPHTHLRSLPPSTKKTNHNRRMNRLDTCQAVYQGGSQKPAFSYRVGEQSRMGKGPRRRRRRIMGGGEAGWID